MLISSDLSWSRHIDSICAKGKRLIGLLYRRFSTNVSSERLIEMYKYLVRPHLEYAAPVWDPHLLKDIKSVENVQKYGLKMCLKKWDLGYQELLHLAQIPTLENRRIYNFVLSLRSSMVSSLSHLMYLCHNLVDITIIFHLLKMVPSTTTFTKSTRSLLSHRCYSGQYKWLKVCIHGQSKGRSAVHQEFVAVVLLQVYGVPLVWYLLDGYVRNTIVIMLTG